MIFFPSKEKMAPMNAGKISILGFVIQSLLGVPRVSCEEWQ
jgi:hypothetical protein